MDQSFSITSTIRQYPKCYPYREIKNKILGSRYELSLVFVGPQRAQTINKNYRNKSYTPNVLSFPLSKTCGEIFICPEVAYKEARNFDLTPQGHVAFLFIHGLLHLKGHDHGDTMEKLERKYCKAFGVK